MTVNATHFDNLDEFKKAKIAGSFHCTSPDEYQEALFWYCCPCGCKHYYPLAVGINFKPPHGPSWSFNNDTKSPTLHPSVNHENHWHGWLQNGVWRLA